MELETPATGQRDILIVAGESDQLLITPPPSLPSRTSSVGPPILQIDLASTQEILDQPTTSPLTSAAFHILLALAAGERHGYALIQEIATLTEGRVRLGHSTLYRTIQRLLDDWLIVETDEHAGPIPDAERRRYYRLTDMGRRVIAGEVAHLETLVRVARERRLLPHHTAAPGAC